MSVFHPMQSHPERAINVLTTLYQMLKDRGYTLDPPFDQDTPRLLMKPDSIVSAAQHYTNENIVMSGWRWKQSNDDISMNETKEKKKEMIQVKVWFDSKTKIESIRALNKIYEQEYQSFMQQKTHTMTKLLLVVQSITKAGILLFEQSKKYMEYALESYFYRNKSLHSLVPPKNKIVLLNKKQVHDVLTLYKTTSDKIMNLPENDPIAKYYGFEVGNILKITFNFDSTLEEIVQYFRVSNRTK